MGPNVHDRQHDHKAREGDGIPSAGRVHGRFNRELQGDEGGPRTANPSRIINVGGDSEFLAKSHEGASPDKETYSYFCEDEGTASGFGGTSLQLPALGVILNRDRFRKIQTSICASQCGIILPAFAEERAKQGDHRELPECCPV